MKDHVGVELSRLAYAWMHRHLFKGPGVVEDPEPQTYPPEESNRKDGEAAHILVMVRSQCVMDEHTKVRLRRGDVVSGLAQSLEGPVSLFPKLPPHGQRRAAYTLKSRGAPLAGPQDGADRGEQNALPGLGLSRAEA